VPDGAPAEVTVSVDDEHATDVQGVAERLRAVGLSIEELFEELGVIVGRIDASQADRLRDVEGVASVERSRSYQLPPPESEIQ
jgi:hypothetical protein